MAKVPSLKDLISKTIDFEDNLLPQHEENLSVLAALKGLSFPKSDTPQEIIEQGGGQTPMSMAKSQALQSDELNPVDVANRTERTPFDPNAPIDENNIVDRPPSQSAVVNGVRTPIAIPQPIQRIPGKGVEIPVSQNAIVNKMPDKPTPEMIFNTNEQLRVGTPEDKMAALEELKQTEPQKVSAMSLSRPLLTPEGLDIAVKAVIANPAAIGNYPVYQKSQITNEISKRGGKIYSAQQYGKIQEALSSANKTTATLNLLETAFNKTSPLASQYETWKKFPEKYATQKTRFDNELVAYDGLIKGSVGNLARSLFGEKGVLTDQDVERVKAALPNALTTNTDLAKIMFSYLKTLNNAVANGTISAYDYQDNPKVLIDDIVEDLENIKSTVKGNTVDPLEELVKKYKK